jgi:hypothetical protein
MKLLQKQSTLTPLHTTPLVAFGGKPPQGKGVRQNFNIFQICYNRQNRQINYSQIILLTEAIGNN